MVSSCALPTRLFRFLAVIATVVASFAALLVAAPPASASGGGILEVVVTALSGEGVTCPVFAGGVAGYGDAVEAEWGETVTLCTSIRNVGTKPVKFPRLQVEANGTTTTFAEPELGKWLPAGVEMTVRKEIVVDMFTPWTATATVSGRTPFGFPVARAVDVAAIDATIPPELILPADGIFGGL